MFDEQWQFAVEVERKYAKYRKKVMVRYDLSAAGSGCSAVSCE